MCGVGELPAKISDFFKKFYNVNANLYTIPHYVCSKAERPLPENERDFYKIDLDLEIDKPIPYKLTFEKELTDKLCILVFSRSEGSTEWDYFKPHKKYYDENLSEYAI